MGAALVLALLAAVGSGRSDRGRVVTAAANPGSAAAGDPGQAAPDRDSASAAANQDAPMVTPANPPSAPGKGGAPSLAAGSVGPGVTNVGVATGFPTPLTGMAFLRADTTPSPQRSGEDPSTGSAAPPDGDHARPPATPARCRFLDPAAEPIEVTAGQRLVDSWGRTYLARPDCTLQPVTCAFTDTSTGARLLPEVHAAVTDATGAIYQVRADCTLQARHCTYRDVASGAVLGAAVGASVTDGYENTYDVQADCTLRAASCTFTDPGSGARLNARTASTVVDSSSAVYRVGQDCSLTALTCAYPDAATGARIRADVGGTFTDATGRRFRVQPDCRATPAD